MKTKSKRNPTDLPVLAVTEADLDPHPALKAWRAVTNAADDDLVFCGIGAPARPKANLDTPMSARTGRAATALFCRTGGLGDGFTTRSMRSGRVVDALAAGATFAQAKAITQHRFDQTVLEYAVVADPLAVGWHLTL